MNKTSTLSLAFVLLCSTAASADGLKGQWQGPCSDGSGEGLQLAPPFVRMISTMSYGDTRAAWKMTFFMDDACAAPVYSQTYEGESLVQETSVSGRFEQLRLSPLSQAETDKLNAPSPFCSIAAWKTGDERDITSCDAGDAFLLNTYSYEYTLSNGDLIIGGRLAFKRTGSL